MGDLHTGLQRAREQAGYTQDDAGAALGVSRAMVSYWEAGSRVPNDRQTSALARLYGVAPLELLEGRAVRAADVDVAGMLLRADDGIAAKSAHGLREFGRFLARYAELADIVSEDIEGMTKSPFRHRAEFIQKNDIRRKAQDVREFLGLGTAPIYDLDSVCEILGITVYRANLGADLLKAPSGAFLNHPDVGFSILVNLDMTPGRQRFTIAHELAHALFHSHETNRIVSRVKSPLESFADTFAGEFLMPTEGVRTLMEEKRIPPRLQEPEDAVFLQRYYHVSWPTALVKLRQMNAVTESIYIHFKQTVRPVVLAQSLGYNIDPEERAQETDRWRVRRFPRQFLRMLHSAVVQELISPQTAASLSGLALPEIVDIINQGPVDTKQRLLIDTEFAEYEETNVI